MERLGAIADEEGGREVYLAHLDGWEDLARLLAEPTWRDGVEQDASGFALFIAGDARAVTDESIAPFARRCIETGCYWVSTWGPGCERLHDILDEVAVTLPGLGVLTTWHDDEPLDKAMLLFWYAQSGDVRRDGPVRVVIVVGNREWEDEAADAVARHLSGK